jgi:hypothetical protein
MPINKGAASKYFKNQKSPPFNNKKYKNLIKIFTNSFVKVFRVTVLASVI